MIHPAPHTLPAAGTQTFPAFVTGRAQSHLLYTMGRKPEAFGNFFSCQAALVPSSHFQREIIPAHSFPWTLKEKRLCFPEMPQPLDLSSPHSVPAHSSCQALTHAGKGVPALRRCPSCSWSTQLLLTHHLPDLHLECSDMHQSGTTPPCRAASSWVVPII